MFDSNNLCNILHTSSTRHLDDKYITGHDCYW